MRHQRGGTFLGFILGLVAGLGVALTVAMYVSKVPVPFVSKALNHNPDQDATEQQKNKGWDPNAPLYGKNPAKPDSPAEQMVPETAASAAVIPKAARPAASAAVTGTPANPPAKPELKPAVTADPLGDLARASASAKGAASASGDTPEAFTYFVQVGAFRTAEDAQTQRARLSLGGIETQVSEREQAGQMMHRVRVGPFETREAAERARQKLNASGVDTALVRVQR